MKVALHSGVTCASGSVGMFGFRLDVYAYLADGLLIDTGPGRLARQFKDFFQDKEIARVVLTHHHEDHSGNAAWLADRGRPVYIHGKALSVCRSPVRLPLYRRIFWGGRRSFSPLPLPAALEGKNFPWQVIETPGHTPDHVALYCPDLGAVFSGDLFVSPKTKVLLKGESIPAIMRSLRSLYEKDFAVLFCAHAGPLENGRSLIKMKIDFLENLAGEVLNLHQKGLTVREIDRRIFPERQPIALLSGREWSSEHIISSIIREMT